MLRVIGIVLEGSNQVGYVLFNEQTMRPNMIENSVLVQMVQNGMTFRNLVVENGKLRVTDMAMNLLFKFDVNGRSLEPSLSLIVIAEKGASYITVWSNLCIRTVAKDAVVTLMKKTEGIARNAFLRDGAFVFKDRDSVPVIAVKVTKPANTTKPSQPAAPTAQPEKPPVKKLLGWQEPLFNSVIERLHSHHAEAFANFGAKKLSTERFSDYVVLFHVEGEDPRPIYDSEGRCKRSALCRRLESYCSRNGISVKDFNKPIFVILQGLKLNDHAFVSEVYKDAFPVVDNRFKSFNSPIIVTCDDRISAKDFEFDESVVANAESFNSPIVIDGPFNSVRAPSSGDECPVVSYCSCFRNDIFFTITKGSYLFMETVGFNPVAYGARLILDETIKTLELHSCGEESICTLVPNCDVIVVDTAFYLQNKLVFMGKCPTFKLNPDGIWYTPPTFYVTDKFDPSKLPKTYVDDDDDKKVHPFEPVIRQLTDDIAFCYKYGIPCEDKTKTIGKGTLVITHGSVTYKELSRDAIYWCKRNHLNSDNYFQYDITDWCVKNDVSIKDFDMPLYITEGADCAWVVENCPNFKSAIMVKGGTLATMCLDGQHIPYFHFIYTPESTYRCYSMSFCYNTDIRIFVLESRLEYCDCFNTIKVPADKQCHLFLRHDTFYDDEKKIVFSDVMAYNVHDGGSLPIIHLPLEDERKLMLSNLGTKFKAVAPHKFVYSGNAVDIDSDTARDCYCEGDVPLEERKKYDKPAKYRVVFEEDWFKTVAELDRRFFGV